uniref:Uncharacterized protein n=1 Tax=Paramormyrops kingsleyae TaxID=1676925 RepID=A0A3B3QLU8_9TELE
MTTVSQTVSGWVSKQLYKAGSEVLDVCLNTHPTWVPVPTLATTEKVPSCKTDFLCKDRRKCVSMALVCDGHIHCYDGSDEVSCPTAEVGVPRVTPQKCWFGSQLCQDGSACVLYIHLCDGQLDCKDGSDEDGWGQGRLQGSVVSGLNFSRLVVRMFSWLCEQCLLPFGSQALSQLTGKQDFVVPIWKGKGAHLDCGNYRGLTGSVITCLPASFWYSLVFHLVYHLPHPGTEGSHPAQAWISAEVLCSLC